MSKRYITGIIAPLNRPTVVRVEHLSVGDAQQMTVQNVSFEVFDGQVTALLCKNERQKALLLSCLLGKSRIYNGSISLFGTSIPPLTLELQRQIGVVGGSTFQQRLLALTTALTLDPSLIIFDNPFQNVEFVERVAMERCIQQLRNEGRTILVLGIYPLAVELLSMYDFVSYVQ